jgi:hypothetical protein
MCSASAAQLEEDDGKHRTEEEMDATTTGPNVGRVVGHPVSDRRLAIIRSILDVAKDVGERP